MSALQTWYWVRHAPPINPLGLAYGQMDIDADFSNIPSLQRVGAILPVGAFWLASPLKRAFFTAVHTGGTQSPPLDPKDIRKEPLLIEQSFGQWESVSRQILRHDAAFLNYIGDPVNVAPPGGESLSDLFRRVSAHIGVLENQLQTHDNVIVVCHGGTIRAALSHVTGQNIGAFLKTKLPPLAIARTTYDRGLRAWQPTFAVI